MRWRCWSEATLGHGPLAQGPLFSHTNIAATGWGLVGTNTLVKFSHWALLYVDDECQNTHSRWWKKQFDLSVVFKRSYLSDTFHSFNRRTPCSSAGIESFANPHLGDAQPFIIFLQAAQSGYLSHKKFNYRRSRLPFLQSRSSSCCWQRKNCVVIYKHFSCCLYPLSLSYFLKYKLIAWRLSSVYTM